MRLAARWTSLLSVLILSCGHSRPPESLPPAALTAGGDLAPAFAWNDLVPQWAKPPHALLWGARGVVLATAEGLALIDLDSGHVHASATYRARTRSLSPTLDQAGEAVISAANLWMLSTGEMLGFDTEEHESIFVAPDLSRIINIGDGGPTFFEVLDRSGASQVRVPISLDSYPFVSIAAGGALALVRTRSVALLVSTLDGQVVAEVAAPADTSWDGSAVHPSGERVYLLATDGILVEIDGHSGAEVRRVRAAAGPYVDGPVLSPDGATMLVTRNDLDSVPPVQTLIAFDTATLQQRFSILVDGHDMMDCLISPDGTRLILATYEQGSTLFDLSDGSVLAVSPGRGPSAFAADSRRVVRFAEDQLFVWTPDAPEGERVQALPPIPAPLPHEAAFVAFEPATGNLLVQGIEGVVRIAVASGETSSVPCASGPLHLTSTGVVRAAGPRGACEPAQGGSRTEMWARSPAPEAGLIVDLREGLRVRDMQGEVVSELALDEGETAPCSSPGCRMPVELSADGRRVAVVRGPLLRIFDAHTGGVTARATVSDRTAALAISDDGERVLVISDELVATLFHTRDLEVIWTSALEAGAWSPALDRIVLMHEGAGQLVDLRGAAPVTSPFELAPGMLGWVGGSLVAHRAGRRGVFADSTRADRPERRTRILSLDDHAEVASYGDGWFETNDDATVLAVCDGGELRVGPPGELVRVAVCDTHAHGRLLFDGRLVVSRDVEGLILTRVSDRQSIHLFAYAPASGPTGVVVVDTEGRFEEFGRTHSLLRRSATPGAPLEVPTERIHAGLLREFLAPLMP